MDEENRKTWELTDSYWEKQFNSVLWFQLITYFFPIEDEEEIWKQI